MINWSKIKGWYVLISLVSILGGVRVIQCKCLTKGIFIPLGDYAIPMGGFAIAIGIYILYLAFTQ
jgi:hypothetical protein